MILHEAVALITGGVQGFGKEFAKCLLSKGTRVVVVDINVELGEKFQEECNKDFDDDKLKFLKCDVTNSEELNRTFELAKSEFGRLDIVCNNAGMISTKESTAKRQVDLNLTAVIEGTYKAIDLMGKTNGGNGGLVVNVASAAGFQLMVGAAIYTATKHAVVAFTRSFQHLPNHAVDNVRVNCVCPFFCDTEMLRKASEENPELMERIKKFGTVQISDVVKAFMKCVEEENMNANAVAILPPNQIFDVSFPPVVPTMISDVVKAFLKCIEEENMNANAVAILPPGQIFNISFPPVVSKM